MKKQTVLLALSGGVDSSVAALLLKKQGYHVIAAFMKNFSRKTPLSSECTWKAEKRMAIKITSQLKIPLYTLDFEKEYKSSVIKPMFDDYKSGLTPNPDILCNRIIKFPMLKKAAKKIKADYIATGHYARIKKTKSGFQLLTGKDKTKDQSYFLSELSQSDLEKTLFPIGNLTKLQVREIAKKQKFPNYDKQGTRGICFIGKLNLKQFLEKKIKNIPGKIKDQNNKTIGTHPGIFYYTIGQRVRQNLGFKINKHLNEKYYIAEKKKNNILIIAPENHSLLKKQIVYIKKIHLINPKEKIPSSLSARIRNLGEFHKGKLKKINKKYQFKFNNPIEQIAPGQQIVFYHKQQLIGSGEIRI